MLKLFVVAVVVAAVAADLDADWSVFKAHYNKKYTPELEAIRRYIWSENKQIIEDHNKLFRQGLTSYYLGENEYADLTSSEFASRMNGFKVKVNDVVEKVPLANTSSLPSTVDWRTKGYVTPIKNQKDCGSCWAFSATGSMEGQHFKATNKLVSLSESNLVDCSSKFGNNGCEGGLMDDAFKYVIANKGIDTEASYPYKPKDAPCKFQANNIGATISSYKDIKAKSEPDLQQAVAEVGPISVAIDASRNSFHLYKGGVYDDPKCSSTMLDHGVLAVGYGTYQGKDYWLVKNSWGTSWGEKGYIMMSRNKKNQCGIATQASYPIV